MQASFWQQKLQPRLRNSSLKQWERLIFRTISRRKFRRTGGWLLGSFAVTGLLIWNWKLILATASGISCLGLVYILLGWDWQSYWSRWRRFFQGSQGRLTLAVGSGGVASLTTYIAASIWAESENCWLAVGAILQGLATVITLAILLCQVLVRQQDNREAKFERLLADLTETEPLKRLIAVRQLGNFAKKTNCHPDYQEQVVEYFRWMLVRETDSAIREAILDSLQAWEKRPGNRHSQTKQPLPIPVDLKHHKLQKNLALR